MASSASKRQREEKYSTGQFEDDLYDNGEYEASFGQVSIYPDEFKLPAVFKFDSKQSDISIKEGRERCQAAAYRKNGKLSQCKVQIKKSQREVTNVEDLVDQFMKTVVDPDGVLNDNASDAKIALANLLKDSGVSFVMCLGHPLRYPLEFFEIYNKWVGNYFEEVEYDYGSLLEETDQKLKELSIIQSTSRKNPRLDTRELNSILNKPRKLNLHSRKFKRKARSE